MTAPYQHQRTVAETGCEAGDLLLGICECNRGMLIQVHGSVAPCYDAEYECNHELEDVVDLHNFVRIQAS